ncbi:SET domain-containing protein-lysine N-methyltransferase [Candidatus Woesearchaeota archaeon]|nr:SET domain-containing protein-lysine N-methyltransferase [Candidatus Woesearchaeota archaeon]
MSYTIKNCRFGRGIFATRNISKGETIITITGPIITQKEVDKRSDKEAANALQIDDDLYIDFQEPGVLVNHSCNPNTGISRDTFLIAIKDISVEEEITWDYSTSVDTGWTMRCACEEKSCRKVVKDFESIPINLQKKYLKQGIVMTYIKKKVQ